MNISYDSKVDALYIKILPGQYEVETRTVDDDIALDFDETDRLVGIEVLDASRRVDLAYLLPVDAESPVADSATRGQASSPASKPIDWDKLVDELLARKEAGKPVETLNRGYKNWVEEVGDDYVVVRRDKTGNTVKITRRQLEGPTKAMLAVTGAILAMLANLTD